MIIKQESRTITLHLSEEQYKKLEEQANTKGVSIGKYTLYRVCCEDDQLPLSQKLLLTPEEARELLGIGRTVMYRLIKEGIIPAVKLPGCRKLFVSMDGLHNMIATYTVAASEIGGEDDE